jgi:hypothetical protein
LTRNDPYAAEEIYPEHHAGALTGLSYLRDSKQDESWIFSFAKAESKTILLDRSPEENKNRSIAAGGDPYRPEHLCDFTKDIETGNI